MSFMCCRSQCSEDGSGKRVYITRRIPTPGLQLLHTNDVIIDFWDSDDTIPHDVLVEKMKNKYDGLYCMHTDTIDKTVIDAGGSQLKAICTMSVGFDHMDMKEIKKKGIVAANCSQASTDCVSDFAVTLILVLARRIVEATNAVKAGEWTTWKPMWLLGFEIINKSVGIFGLGRIGFGIAKRLVAFKVSNIYYNDLYQIPHEKNVNAIYVSFDEMLQKSDIVCITCNLTDATRGKFNKDAFNKMKETAVLVNVSRGGVVNHNDLYEALRDKKIASAALDVTEPEPIPINHPLMSMENCIITPHVASKTGESQKAWSLLTAENMLNILSGEEPLGKILV